MVKACVSVALKKNDIVSQNDFIAACEKAVDERTRVNSAKRLAVHCLTKKRKNKGSVSEGIRFSSAECVKTDAL